MEAVIETFKPVKGYEGLYEVSDYGAVRSLRFGKVKYLKAGKNSSGYLFVVPCVNGKTKIFIVHRLVYETFVGPIPEDMEIDHINGVKDDNRLVNLRCVTPKENCNNPVTRERYLEAIRKTNPEKNRRLSQDPKWREAVRNAHNKPVLQLDKSTGEVIREWECASDAYRELGINFGSISKCCNGKLNSAGGFKWRFA